MKLISEFIAGDKLTVQLLVGNFSKGTNAANGKEYLSLELRDSSGSINAKKWDYVGGDENVYAIGNIVEINCEVISYRDNLQLKIVSGRPVDIDSIDVVRFVKQPPIPKAELVKKFDNYVASIKDPTCKKILDYIVDKTKDKLYDYPAASSIHHDYACGILVHSTNMADIAEFLCKQYKDLDRDLLLTGVLLHDLGKTFELEGPIAFHYSLEGKLLGHISIMAAEIRSAAQKLGINNERALLIQHMILSHHGQQEFGSPVLPITKEALMLSLIDNLDSKMEIVNKALDKVKPGEFSNKVLPLDGRMFYNPKVDK